MKKPPKAIEILHRPLRMKTRILKQHGAREMARRKEQISKGQLKIENGLIASC